MTAKRKNQALRALKQAGIGVIVAMALLAPARAQMRGDCIRVEPDAPVILPNGSTHEAQALKLCFDRSLNPSTGLHAVQVDGLKAGMAMSRIGRSEDAAGRNPLAVFERTANDELRLIGYAVPAGKRMKTYTLRAFGKRDDALQANHRLLDEPRDRDELIVLVARRTR